MPPPLHFRRLPSLIQHKETQMDETRINAAIAEMNQMIQYLLQRNINLAGELAIVQKQVNELATAIEASANIKGDAP